MATQMMQGLDMGTPSDVEEDGLGRALQMDVEQVDGRAVGIVALGNQRLAPRRALDGPT